jgi:hypothetical protein
VVKLVTLTKTTLMELVLMVIITTRTLQFRLDSQVVDRLELQALSKLTNQLHQVLTLLEATLTVVELDLLVEDIPTTLELVKPAQTTLTTLPLLQLVVDRLTPTCSHIS